MDNFTRDSYDYCRWGVLLGSSSNSLLGTLSFGFNALTKTPYNSLNTDLFFARGNQGVLERRTYLNGEPFPTPVTWSPPTFLGAGNITFNNTDASLFFYRYLHFQNQLDDEINNTSVPSTARKLVILVHGWNSSAQSDSFVTAEFSSLRSALRSALANSDWRLVRYHWEADADTGIYSFLDTLFSFGATAAQDATEAATISRFHGQHLGELLAKNFPNLEKVQFVAHSAGAWAARSAARYLLQSAPNCSVQVTLLDPFIPSVVGPGTVLTTSVVSGMANFPGSPQLKRLENYYSSDFIQMGTEERFSWRPTDINSQVSWSTLFSSFYSGHSSPIQFYADTVWATLPGQVPASGLENFDVNPKSGNRIGWTRSLFYNEPVYLQSPQDQSVTAGSSVALNSIGTSRNATAADNTITYQWRRNGVLLSGATSATLRIASVQTSDAGDYTVTISNPSGSTTSPAAKLSVSASTFAITAQPRSQTISAGSNLQLNVSVSGGTGSFTYQWRFNGQPLLNGSTNTYSATNVGTGFTGTFDVVVSDGITSITSAPAAVTVSGAALRVATQPQSQSLLAGGTLSLAVTASGGTGAYTYQWRLNGTALAFATSNTYVVALITPTIAGVYTVTVSDGLNTVTSEAATITVEAVSRISNLSIRSQAGTNAQTLIVGFVVGGAETNGTKPLLIRGTGPALTAFGVTGQLADPKLELYSGATKISENNNWGGNAQVSAIGTQVGAFALSNPASLDAALFSAATAAGTYSAQISGADGNTGIALAEIYDASPTASFAAATPRLTNISARTQVGAGTNILISGFTISGSAAKTVLIRAVGPSLALFGVTGVLVDPKLELYRSGAASPLSTNDNWDSSGAATFARVGAFSLAAGSRDAALILTLQPGGYTAQVSGVGGATGVALVEIYEVP